MKNRKKVFICVCVIFFIGIVCLVYYIIWNNTEYRRALRYSIDNSEGEYKRYEAEIQIDKDKKKIDYNIGCSRGNYLSLVKEFDLYRKNNPDSYLNNGFSITFVFKGKASQIPYMIITNTEMDGTLHEELNIVRMETLHGGLQDLECDSDGKIVGVEHLEIPNAGEKSAILEYVNLFSDIKKVALIIKDDENFTTIAEAIHDIFPKCNVLNYYNFYMEEQRK